MKRAARLTGVQRANYATLLRAAEKGDLALMALVRTGGEPVAALCAMQDNGDGTMTPVPLAYLIDGDPYEGLQAPFMSGETKQ